MIAPSTFSRRQVLTGGLATAAVLALGSAVSARGETASVLSASKKDDLVTAAQETYAKLKAIFQQDRNYWRLGQTFDTIIDYFVVTQATAEATAFTSVALDRYAASRGSWYDDYAWWAISNLKAAQHKELFGDATDTFFKNSLECWQKMAPSTDVWNHAQALPKFAVLKPAVPGGVWNHAYDSSDTGSYNPLNPNGDPLGGYQNTVTNSLRLVLAARLTRHDGQAAGVYRDAMESAYRFLQDWLTMTRPGLEPLLNVFEPGKAVVRERISAYDSGLQLNGYRSRLAWAGDQGLVIGGLAERMEIVGKSDPTYPAMLGVIRQILAGVPNYLSVDGLLLPWWPDPSPGTAGKRPAGDPEDYRTGIGVYVRYLLALHQLNNDDLKEDLAPYRRFVTVNAQHVLNYPSVAERSVDATMVTLTNDLAILTVAIAMG
jgi:hypothetical protein